MPGDELVPGRVALRARVAGRLAAGALGGAVEGLELALEQRAASRVASLVTTPIASIAPRSARRPRPAETGCLHQLDGCSEPIRPAGGSESPSDRS
ncbi:MAG: hypothetical protein LC777_03350 [Actinobacteria bacterium]|nr:hypothetical protein [Actinomycetota bacterium]